MSALRIAALTLILAGCATPRGPVTVPLTESTRGVRPDASAGQTGKASWYGEPHHGHRTASGETYDMYELTAAHPSLPLGSRVLVTNLNNGRSVEVRINDRGPHRKGRIIDLSLAAARKLGAGSAGTIPVRVRVLSRPTE